MVRALAIQNCGTGWIPVVEVICGFSLLLCLVLALTVCLQILHFSFLHRRYLCKFQAEQESEGQLLD